MVYSPRNSNRLKFVLDWLIGERLQLAYVLIHDEQLLAGRSQIISYGRIVAGAVSIPDNGLLWDTGKAECSMTTGLWGDLPTVFDAAPSGMSVPFDLFSALFFLLSRYEEYYAFTPDKHGRYPAAASVLFKNGWLSRPVADEWVARFRQLLNDEAGIQAPATHFVFQPTYDIDMAYSHLYKGITRIAGAYVRAILKMDVMQISERTQVLKNRKKDPYDSFRWLRQLHKEAGCKPVYFILAAFRTTAFDKNIHPEHPAMMRVIKNIARDGVVAVHPSYFSDQGGKMGEEKQILEHISGNKIRFSRQHYIRVTIPDTYRMLLGNGITNDFSMGYGSHLGFRAGTGNSFLWYDLESEQVSPLRLHPFCFMDTTAHFEAGLSVTEAMGKLQAMSSLLEKTGSTLVTIFHNFSLGTASEWKGWRSAYEHFLQEKSSMS